MTDNSLDQEMVRKSIEGADNDSDNISDALSQLMESLSDEDQHTLLTDLSDREIKHISVIATVGEDDDITDTFLKNFKRHKVSKGRKGRQELSNMAEAFAGLFKTENEGAMSKIKGTLGL